MRHAVPRALLLALLLALLAGASGANYAKARHAACASTCLSLTRSARGLSTARSAMARTRAGEANSTPWCAPASAGSRAHIARRNSASRLR